MLRRLMRAAFSTATMLHVLANVVASPFYKFIAVLLLWGAILPISASLAQDGHQTSGLADRPISSVRFEGLKRVWEREVLNNIRSAVGEPFNDQTVKDDVARLNRLGQFRYVNGVVELQSDGSVALIFKFEEQAVIHEVQVVGNRVIPDADLLAVVQLVPRGPRDDFLIENAKRAIESLYRKRGHYLTTVSIDETELENAGLLLFRVIEGPRVKIKAIVFEGNQAFTDEQLLAEIKTRTAMIILRKGELDEERLADDVATLDRYYKDRGYLDVRVDRQIDLSPDNSEAKVTFLIAEGPRYTLRDIQAHTVAGGPLKVFAPEQIAAIMELKRGDVYSRDLLRKSVKAIQDSYGLMGYLLSEDDRRFYQSEDDRVFVRPIVMRAADQPQVDLLLEIDEGEQYQVGLIQINGNFLTRDKVIRRELRGITPGRPFDATKIEEAEIRLARTRLFNEPRITIQREDPDNPGFRDVLVEVKERNTGSANFGVAVGSDSGVFGEFSLTQNNFDVTDVPESLSELFTGRAFRGGGQRFNITVRPGSELFQFLTSLTEPHIFESDFSFTLGGQIRERIYDLYDEKRYGGYVRLGRQFGDVWNFSLNSRAEEIELDDIEPSAPTEVFLDAGPDLLTTLGVSLTRTTIGTAQRPGRGTRLELSLDRYGAYGGDFDFNMANFEYTVYFTVGEDFLGRTTTLRLSSRLGYIFGGRAPTYESFYLGGRSFRGFEFRTISPKGIANDTGLPSDDPVGGDWLAFFGAQFETPILGEALTGVLFVDSGTVTDDPGFDEYRLSVGAGIRLYIPQLGDVPIAFDFGFPVLSEDSDEEQVFSFSAELPF
ncbi:MAG: outer membrane protein assembly factor BamA [Phycisphaerales bacterium]|nr:outer membrane protein assembly factor BamA [Phycisphaerales bacterium]